MQKEISKFVQRLLIADSLRLVSRAVVKNVVPSIRQKKQGKMENRIRKVAYSPKASIGQPFHCPALLFFLVLMGESRASALIGDEVL